MNFLNINKIIETNNKVSSKRWIMVGSFLVAFILSAIVLFAPINPEKYEIALDLIDGWLMLSGASGGFVLAERFSKNNNKNNDTSNSSDN
jgi:glycopeptide antibiotics resistance protein